jgi:hypothetical protein
VRELLLLLFIVIVNKIVLLFTWYIFVGIKYQHI